jgi:hypothetical protein
MPLKILGCLLCLWVLIAAIAIYPDELSYFNESACLLDSPGLIGWDGGSRCGPAWLDDSNVDWGQSLNQLRAWLTGHPLPRPVHFGYFGSFPPASYGLPVSAEDLDDVLSGTKPGLYVVSGHILAHARDTGPNHSEWLLHARPTAVVGHAYYMYDRPSAAGDQPREGQ